MSLVYADYIMVGWIVLLTWIFPGMEPEFEDHFKHLFWRFYISSKND